MLSWFIYKYVNTKIGDAYIHKERIEIEDSKILDRRNILQPFAVWTMIAQKKPQTIQSTCLG